MNHAFPRLWHTSKFLRGLRPLAAFLYVALSACLMAGSNCARAQAPYWSRGLQLIKIKVSEASSRATAALEAEGYTITNRSGASEDAFFAGGQKGNHAAVIMCDKAPGSAGTWVNIVVATTNARDNGVPGLERQHLQARMDRPGAAPPTGVPGTWVYFDSDSSYSIKQTFSADGTILAADGAHATWKIEGGELVTHWQNGWVNRLKWPPNGNKLSGVALGPNGEKHSITLTRQ